MLEVIKFFLLVRLQDRDVKMHIGKRRGSVDEEFSGRIKNFEEKLRGTPVAEKKPRDLLRAIGEKNSFVVKAVNVFNPNFHIDR